MADENPIFAEIDALLSERAKPGLDQLEDTLTSGYAAALALEAERWRIERRISEVAALLGDGQRGGTKEIVKLAERQAAELLAEAKRREREVRLGAEDYADDILSTLEVNLGKFLAAVQRGREQLQQRNADRDPDYSEVTS